MTRPDGPAATNGELVGAADMANALTAATLVFDDGATQTFTPDGRTTYVEQQSTGPAWGVRFLLSFTDSGSGRRFDGRYRR